MPDAERPWVDGLTFAEVLRGTAERHGDRDALVFPWLNYRRSYAEFRTDVRRAARALLALGVGRGEHVGIWATNWPQWVILQFAAAHAGAVLVNVNPAYRAHELRLRPPAGRHHRPVPDGSLQDLRLLRHAGGGLSRVAAQRPREPRPAACPRLRHAVSIKETKRPGVLAWGEFLALRPTA